MWFSRYMRFPLRYKRKPNGDGEIRTLDPLLARQVLSQLSYTPIYCNQSAEQTDYLHAHQRVSFFRNLAPTCSPMPSPA